MPPGVKEGFSYGGRLCSIVGWLGYGGNLTWRKQEYFAFICLGGSHFSGESGKNAALVPTEQVTFLSTVALLTLNSRELGDKMKQLIV
ncbi:MAG: hypothetical protein F6K50_37705 [Moorea sp. SIO3I7]|nr:hypothetical protein [Moorena sp. SIO3I7]